MQDGDDRKEDNVATKDQANKTIETLNRSKQNVTKQYKTKDETEPREQKQQSKTISDRTKKNSGHNTKVKKTGGFNYKWIQRKPINKMQIMEKVPWLWFKQTYDKNM